MRVRVDSALHIARHEMRPSLLERLVRALTFQGTPGFDRTRRDRTAPEVLCLVEETPAGWTLPRGAIHVLRKIATEHQQELQIDDRRVDPGPTMVVLPTPPLRAYQRRAVEKFATIKQGTVVIPCGGGKTRVGLGVIAQLARPTLILVHTLDLAAQWREEIQKTLGQRAGLIGDGEESTAPITVAVIQALARWEHANLDAFLLRFGLLILDEAHHVAASVFRAVVHRCPARYRLGLTATPQREDGLTPLLELFLGRTVVRVGHASLIVAGVLAVPEIRRVETAFEYPYRDADDYNDLLAALAADEARNDLVVAHVATDAREGHTCLVLSGRIRHCETLREKLEAQGVSVALLTGRVPKERRRKVLEAARAGTLPVLIATSLADEGLDLPRLSRVFLSFPSRARGRTIQRLGRLMRPHPEKRGAVLVDFVDRRVPILRGHHLERRRLYAEILGADAIQPLTHHAAGSRT